MAHGNIRQSTTILYKYHLKRTKQSPNMLNKSNNREERGGPKNQVASKNQVGPKNKIGAENQVGHKNKAGSRSREGRH